MSDRTLRIPTMRGKCVKCDNVATLCAVCGTCMYCHSSEGHDSQAKNN